MEHYFQTFFAYVEESIVMPDSDKQRCRGYMKPVKKAKGSVISERGKIPEFHNFIVSGHMRNFHIDENGDEVTVDLNEGPRFFSSYYFFANQEVSPETVHCITDCELLQMTFDDVIAAAKASETQLEYSVKILQKVLEEDKQRITDMAKLGAEQRYLKLLNEKPNIVKNVPLKYIASYLGIKAESLSRIRRLIN